MTLRLRLASAAGILVVVLVAVGFLLVRTVESSELAQTDRQLLALVPVALTLGPSPHIGPGTPPRSGGSDTELSDIYVAIVNHGHRQTVATPTSGGGAVPSTPARRSKASPAAVHPTTVSSLSGSGRWRAALITRPSGGQVLIALSLNRVDATTRQLRLALLAAAGLFAVVLAASAFWLERLGLRPIAEVKAVAEAIVDGDRSRRATPTTAGAETSHLARAFNLMLDNQETLEARLRQFVADASHELRTPTSVISGIAQLWQQGDLRNGQPLQEAMRRVGQESTRMRALVDELLLLARLDEGGPLEQIPVDIAKLARDAATEAATTYPSRPVQTETDDPVVTIGDPIALRQVVTNLVANALIHTPPSALVTVRASSSPDGAVFEVADSGPGMSEEEADHAFDRFWRGAPSRTRPGSGLGLSIVKAIAAAHHGQVTMDTTQQGGTTATVVLPLAHPLPPGLPANPQETFNVS